MTNQYMNNLYRDLLSNSPQTITIDIPTDMGTGQISQIVTKQGAVVSDWRMNYFSDMNVQGVSSEEYIQMLFCFNDGVSLLENIRLGRLTATDEEVIEAAKKAQCMEFIEKLPQGIHSMAGDAGKMLSGGQRQRISLARAILKDAPIVVLDEATAYADPENEEKMEAAIAELVEGKTLVVIAHKLPAIMNADQICVMDHGKMVATGKHQELIQACPEYQKLWKASQDSAEWKVSTAKEGR